jgi:hypothetical protein
MNANELNIIFRIDDKQVVEKERILRQTIRSLVEQDKAYAEYEKYLAQDNINLEKQKSDKIKQINQQEAKDRKQILDSLQRSLSQQHDEFVKQEEKAKQEVINLEKQKSAEKKNVEKEYQNFLKKEKEKEKQLTRENKDFEKQQNEIAKRDAERSRIEQQRMYNNLFGQKPDSKLTGQSTTLGSVDALKEQIKYFKELKHSVAIGSDEYTKYSAKLRELEAQLKSLQGGGNKLGFLRDMTIAIAGFVEGYRLVVDKVKQAYQIMLEGADFGVLENSFERIAGSEDKARRNLELFDKALAGNRSDDKIMRMSNSFQELEYGTLQQAQMFNFAEDASDAFNISIEEGISKLTTYFETGRDKGRVLGQIGIDTRKVNKAVDDYAKSIGTTTENLGAEATAQLRARFTMELYGKSLEEIKNKQQDNADKLTSLTVAYDNFTKYFGKSMSEMVVGGKVIGSTTKDVKTLGDQLGTLTGIMINVSTWFNTYANVISAPFILALKAWNNLKSSLQYFGIMDKPGDIDKYKTESIDPKKEAEINKVVQDRRIEQEKSLRIEQEAIKLRKENPKLSIRDAVLMAQKKESGETVKMPGSGKDKKEEISEERNLIEQIETRISLSKNLNNYTREQIELDKQQLLAKADSIDSNSSDIKQLKLKNDLIETYNKLVKEYGNPLRELPVTKTFQGDITPEKRDLPDYSFEQGDTKRKIEEQERNKQEASAQKVVDTMSQGVGVAQQVSDVLGIGADSFVGKFLNGISQGLSLANSFASFLSMVFNIGSGGSGGFFSLLGLSEGTNEWPGGWALVGDDGGRPTPYSEVAYLAPGSKVIGNKKSRDLLSWLGYDKMPALYNGTVSKTDITKYNSVRAERPVINLTTIVQSELEKHKITKVIYNENINSNIYANKKVMG